jgi:hypothetical protein|nr:MAG TPA: hypothetical protein [Caudoviricetes sp.]
MEFKRIEELETTKDGVKNFILAYKNNEIIDVEPLRENEEIVDIKLVQGNMVKILIFVGDKK